MKKSYIVLLIVIAIAIGAVMATLSDASTYVNFAKAEQNPGKVYTVIGQLDREKPMDFDARAGVFSFYAVDKEGNSRKVLYFKPKPTDFERSEDITMKGYSTDSAFVADEILLKCPSKYNEQNKLKEGKTDGE
ncbi:MAG: cytochrome c maturation protein CcmE [Thermaurantimonas sp.]|uniref:cytochrome c maturation protein CcmE domain-containing protein n=1 Tax=Thermaurantimonas sp. TaxID=2681568 RepID=UPI00391D343A